MASWSRDVDSRCEDNSVGVLYGRFFGLVDLEPRFTGDRLVIIPPPLLMVTLAVMFAGELPKLPFPAVVV